MARDKQPSSLPFLREGLEPTVLDAAKNIDPDKIKSIEAAIDQHKSENGEVHPGLVKALNIAKKLSGN